MKDIIQLKITLADTYPPIWRRVQVDRGASFFEFHHILQIVMGWKNSHLYEFKFNNCRITEITDGLELEDFGDNTFIDSFFISLGGILVKEGQQLEYEYDFGDGWNHEIIVEKFLPEVPKMKYPTCIGGELSCPPEDCGGTHGFKQLLEIVANKKHPEHKEMMIWVGKKYDPKYFDKDAVNKKLKSLDKYILESLDYN